MLCNVSANTSHLHESVPGYRGNELVILSLWEAPTDGDFELLESRVCSEIRQHEHLLGEDFRTDLGQTASQACLIFWITFNVLYASLHRLVDDRVIVGEKI